MNCMQYGALAQPLTTARPFGRPQNGAQVATCFFTDFPTNSLNFVVSSAQKSFIGTAQP